LFVLFRVIVVLTKWDVWFTFDDYFDYQNSARLRGVGALLGKPNNGA